MANKFLVMFTALLLAAMLFACGAFSVGFIIAGGAVPIIFGIALACLCLLGGWSLYQELRFGVMSEKVCKGFAGEGLSLKYGCHDEISDGGSAVQAERKCGYWRERVNNNPRVYGSWYRLALAYDEAGDRKGARAAMREAIQLYNRQGRVETDEKV